MTTDLDALVAAVEAAPADDAPKLVLADWLADRGVRPDAEAAIRWCVRTGRWPWMDAGPEYGASFGRFWWGDPDPSTRPHGLPDGADRHLLALAEWHTDDLLALLDGTGRALRAAGLLDEPCDLLGTPAPVY